MNSHNLLLVQGGGPTQVLNATLASILKECREHTTIGKIYGARSGVAGLSAGNVVELTSLPEKHLRELRISPGAALGSSRSCPSEEEYRAICEHLRRLDIGQALFLGGNGTMYGAQMLAARCREAGLPLRVIGVPKTVDNDLTETDRCPGYGSAARYVAQSTRDLGMDLRSLPQPVTIFETMGREAGWLAAASGVGKADADDAPHLVYVPERAFSVERFLAALERVVTRIGWAVVIVSEGIRDAVGAMVYQLGDPSRADALQRPLTGGVGQHLAGVVAEHLKIRCRSETPGLLGRCSMLHVSAQDMRDAETVGRNAVRALTEGHDGRMVALLPLQPQHEAHAVEESQTRLVPLDAVAGKHRPIPAEWLTDSETAVNEKFLAYVRPQIGELLRYAGPLQTIYETHGVF